MNRFLRDTAASFDMMPLGSLLDTSVMHGGRAQPPATTIGHPMTLFPGVRNKT